MFSSTEIVAEVLIVGILTIVSFLPFVIGHFGWAAIRDAAKLFAEKEKRVPTWIIVSIALAIIYTLGVSTNRILNYSYDFVHRSLCIEKPGAKYDGELREWAKGRPNESPTLTLDTVELLLRDSSDGAGDWVERHKSYERLQRAGTVSGLLFFFFMAAYRAKSPTNFHLFSGRFGISALASLSFSALCCVSYWTEAERFNYRLYNFYTALHPPSVLESLEAVYVVLGGRRPHGQGHFKGKYTLSLH